MAGRPPDPTRARRGTGHRPVKAVATVAEQSPAERFPVPSDLDPQAREILVRAIDELAPRGLRPADFEALLMLAHAAHMHRLAKREIELRGLLVKGPRGPMVNPMVKVARDEAATYLRIANEYGLTLAARLRLGLMQLTGESILASLNKELDTRASTS